MNSGEPWRLGHRPALDGLRGVAVPMGLMLAAGSGAAIWRHGTFDLTAYFAVSVAVAACAVLVVHGVVLTPGRMTRRAAIVGILLVFGFFVVWYVLFQPVYGYDSDSAEALGLGVRQLSHLSDPWAVETRLGNPLSPMIGGYLLAAPFVLLAGSVYTQQIVVFAVLLVTLWRAAGANVALGVATLFAFSAQTAVMVPNQNDSWIDAVSVLLAAWWGLRAVRDRRWIISSAALFGVTLSYRFILWVAVVPLAVYLVREFGWRRAIRWLGVAGVVTVALSFGPLLVVPDAYMAGPVAMGLGKVGGADTIPGAGIIVAVVTLTTLGWASTRVRTWGGVWLATSLSLAVMIATVAVTRLPGGARAAFASYTPVAYNGTFLIFGAVGYCLLRWAGTAQSGTARVLDQRASKWASVRASASCEG